MEEFKEEIKQWVKIDNLMKEKTEELKVLRTEKNSIQEEILTYVEENELNTSTIQISDGTLKFNKSKQIQGLTMKYVEDCLVDLIDDVDKVKDIMKHIKTNREHKYTNEIKRFKKS
jgi:hypothetical protein